jgi:hypothetical protein
MSKLFLSYSSRDRTLAAKIAQDLRTAGIDVWFDEWQLKVGDSIAQKIDEGLNSADFVAVLLSRQSVESVWSQLEWRSKLHDEARSRSNSILPLKADDCELPPLLRDKKYADFSASYETGLSSLLRSVNPEGELADSNATKTDSKLFPTIYLKVLRGPMAGCELSFQKEQITIGRDEQCDLPFPSENKISRVHAKIYYEVDRFWLQDLKSKNKTFTVASGSSYIELDDKPVYLESGLRFRLATVVEIEFRQQT